MGFRRRLVPTPIRKDPVLIFLMLLLERVCAPEIAETHRYRPSFMLATNGKPVLRELSLLPPPTPIDARNTDLDGGFDDTGTVIWQLFSHCAKGFLQMDSTVNCRGSTTDVCKTNFVVRVEGAGSIVLRHALTKKFLCFNRRKRITMRVDQNDIKCHFIEHINEAGYTMLESAWWPRLYLGFNHKGRFQDPAQFRRKYRCFLFTKLERFAPARELRKCSRSDRSEVIRRHRDEHGVISNSILELPNPAQAKMERALFQHARTALLQKVEA